MTNMTTKRPAPILTFPSTDNTKACDDSRMSFGSTVAPSSTSPIGRTTWPITASLSPDYRLTLQWDEAFNPSLERRQSFCSPSSRQAHDVQGPTAGHHRGRPTTPRCKARTSSPPLAPNGRTSSDLLLRALQQDSIEAVREVCGEDLEVARDPLMESGFEPPLCAAVRLHCGSEVLALLLEHGAEVDATDMNGRTPLAILCSLPGHEDIEEDEGSLAAAQVEARVAALRVLLSAGAGVTSVDEMGRCATDIARMCNNMHLAHAIEETK